MKRFVILPILITVSFLVGCDTGNETDEIDSFQFEAKVISKGLDCGETFIISLQSRDEDSNIEDGTYYADNLDSDFKVSGLKILLNCREPNNDELYACTMMGPTYPHVIVIDCKIIDE